MKCFVFLLLSINALLLQAQDSVSIYYKRAQRLNTLGKDAEAEIYARRVIGLQPSDSAYTLMSYIFHKDSAKAALYLDSAVRINPSMENYLRRGWTRERYKAAYDTLGTISDFDSAIIVAPDSAEPYRRMARLMGEMGNYSEAEKYFNLAYNRDTNPCIRYHRGMFYHHHKKYKEALDDLLASYYCQTDYKELIFASMIANCMLQLKDTVGACKFLNKEALARGVATGKDMYVSYCLTNTAEIFYWQGLYDMDKKKKGDAIYSFTRSIQASPSDSAYWKRGTCYKGNVDDKKAIADFDTALMINPNHAEVYIDRAIRKLALNDVKGGVTDLDRAMVLNPKLPSAYWIKAAVYGNKKQKKYKQGIEVLNAGIEAVPNNGTLYRMRGEMYLALKKYTIAIDDFTKAIALKTLSISSAYKYRSECYAAIGDHEKECEDLWHSVSGNTKEREAYYQKCLK